MKFYYFLVCLVFLSSFSLGDKLFIGSFKDDSSLFKRTDQKVYLYLGDAILVDEKSGQKKVNLQTIREQLLSLFVTYAPFIETSILTENEGTKSNVHPSKIEVVPTKPQDDGGTNADANKEPASDFLIEGSLNGLSLYGANANRSTVVRLSTVFFIKVSRGGRIVYSREFRTLQDVSTSSGNALVQANPFVGAMDDVSKQFFISFLEKIYPQEEGITAIQNFKKDNPKYDETAVKPDSAEKFTKEVFK